MTTSVRTSSRSAGPIGGRALVGEFEWIVPLLILITVAFGASWIAVVDPRLAWAAGGVGAIVLGTILTGTRSRWIALSLIPASLLTSSAIVPFEGRYIPVLMLTAALAISLRTRAPAALVFVRQLPRPFVVTVSIYLAWAAIATVVSISFTELEYLGGMAATLSAAFLATPILLSSDVGLRRIYITISASGATLLIVGLVLAAAGGITLLGRFVGVYFVGEVTLLGRPTGIVFPQNYGPYVGPATEYLAFAIATSSYLAATDSGRRRWLWWAVALFCGVGLISTFSREGILMATLATGSVGLGMAIRHRVMPGLVVMTALLAVVLGGTMTGAIGVLGRMDLVRSWYGADAVATLLNPVITDRGDVQHAPEVTDVTGVSAGSGSSGAGSGPGTGQPRPADVIELKSSSSFEARLALWRAAYFASLEAPVFGHGLGSNADAVVPYLAGADARLRGASVHSTVMRVLVELGVPGLLSYLAVMVVELWLAVRAIWQSPRQIALPVAGMVIATLAHQLFGTLLLGGLTFGSYAFAVAVGLLAALLAGPNRRRRRPIRV